MGRKRHQGSTATSNLQEQSGRHIVEQCPELIALRREVEDEWRMRHLRNRKKEKGDIGVEKEKEKEEGEKLEQLEAFFGVLYDFLSDFENFDAMSYPFTYFSSL